MARRRLVWLVVAATLVLAPLAGLAMFSASSQRPKTLGVTKGRLAPCPDSPNCVSSQAVHESQRVEPLKFAPAAGESNAGVSPQMIERLAAIVGTFPRATVVRQTDDYLHAEFTSALFRFVDDVEFYFDRDTNQLHVRSASRVGRSDLGANRRRVEAIRAALRKADGPT